ncbi:MAG: pentapeptide repeat-containing protein [Microcoleus sp. PH2017_29_MFU_D_A]|uniref:pentapeptide repeat-containing protein n=1 Tax=unclassified Microcoleus TaxID=2642155 RepID=UPI001D72D698|nr:pentapeptide repeat-containing protein [Microcoleus sp. PH2017_07_MST_O_A]MCC3424170.1 pentapeptide repeat-containing protein [Microcoleus sp. PH2017_01_SCD_O_A]MCC3432973.1 pentapeptide repeat-containing protein [Microcoleus sp. PH2017_04_SCI_O_A]MCC3436528.1 pentapeptide repeat-containing protein [Microcoleus sp. PH2017_05_CCC_O_A]MCC3453408.1 pentapeptide repeat-containing protein [Microcoleus sp. PH2017_08_TRC_O_A]MCC3471377.1 pentapeptide repeat-containing protein [Microcoleus sp. PH20
MFVIHIIQLIFSFILLERSHFCQRSNANLSDANLGDAQLINANFSGANLREAWLEGADLSGANLSNACERKCNFGLC